MIQLFSYRDHHRGREEVRTRARAPGLGPAVLLTAVVYVSIAFTALSLVGADALAKSDALPSPPPRRAMGLGDA